MENLSAIINRAGSFILEIFIVFAFAKCNTGYQERDGTITFNGVEIKNKSFVVLNEAFAKSDSIVYYKVYEVPGADIATFRPLNDHYAKDTNTLFYCDEEREGQNYFLTKRGKIFTLHDADRATFSVLAERESEYAKDKHNGYYKGVVFEVKDPASLSFIEGGFLKDNYQVYFEQKPLKGADAGSFRILNNAYARDTARVYHYSYQGGLYSGIHEIPCNIPAFTLLDYPYSKDDASAFYAYKKIKGAEGQSLSIIGNDYAKDKSHIFWKDILLPDAEVSNFKNLGMGYATDGKKIYYQSNLMKNADPKTFRTLESPGSDSDAEDGKNIFLEGKVVIVN